MSKLQAIVLVVIALGIVAYAAWRDRRQVAEIVARLDAQLAVGRASTTTVESLKTQVDSLASSTKRDIEGLGAQVVSVGQIVAGYKPPRVVTAPGANTVETRTIERETIVPGECPGPQEIVTTYKDQRIDLEVQALAKHVEYQLHQKFKGALVHSVLASGLPAYHLTLQEVGAVDGTVLGDLTLETFDVQHVDERRPSFHLVAPRVALDLALTHRATVLGMLSVTLMDYGKPDEIPAWRFVGVGVGYGSEGLGVLFVPAAMNVASFWALLRDLWLSPVVGYTEGGGLSFGLGIGSTL